MGFARTWIWAQYSGEMSHVREAGWSVTRKGSRALFNQKVRGGRARVLHPNGNLSSPA
jgi:hypothetical protein